jgi:hypothetical protein
MRVLILTRSRVPDRLRVESGGRPRVDSGSASGGFRVSSRSAPGEFRVDSGWVPGRLRVGSGWAPGWLRAGSESAPGRLYNVPTIVNLFYSLLTAHSVYQYQ